MTKKPSAIRVSQSHPLKNCAACHQQIPMEASVCSVCKSHQNFWTRQVGTIFVPVASLILSSVAIAFSIYSFVITSSDDVQKWMAGNNPALIGTSNWTPSSMDAFLSLSAVPENFDPKEIVAIIEVANEGFALAFPFAFECRFSGVIYNATQTALGLTHSPFTVEAKMDFITINNTVIREQTEEVIEYRYNSLYLTIDPPEDGNISIINDTDRILPSFSMGCFLKYSGPRTGENVEVFIGESDVLSMDGGLLLSQFLNSEIDKTIKENY